MQASKFINRTRSYLCFTLVGLVALSSCGSSRKKAPVATGNKPRSSTTSVDASVQSNLEQGKYNPEAGKSCVVGGQCPTVDVQVNLTGPMSSNLAIKGFIAEAGQPVNWTVQVKNIMNRRMAIFPNNAATLYPVEGAHVAASSVSQGTTTPSDGAKGTAGGNYTYPGSNSTGAFKPTILAPNVNTGTGTGQGSTGSQQDFSAFKVAWPAPGKAEGILSFTIRDLDQCVARSPEGTQALCQQFDQHHIVDRPVEIPFKVDRGILGMAQEEKSLWERLAGCLVKGVLDQASLDSVTGAVIGGAVEGLFGQENNCYGGVSQSPFYRDRLNNTTP